MARWVLLLGLLVAPSGSAAEIAVRREARVASAVVTLGDVAQIVTTDPEQARRLAGIELGLAPAEGARRTIRLREIQDAVTLAGENLALHRMSGASEVQIQNPAPAIEPPAPAPAVSAAPQPRLAPVRHDRLVKEVAGEALNYLREVTGERNGWRVEVRADAATLTTLSEAESYSIGGGHPPYTGLQNFRVVCQTPDGPAELRLPVEVEQAPACVVLKRAINRGTVLGPGDVELAIPPDAAIKATDTVYYDLDQVHGQELTQTLPAGSVVKATVVAAPVVVKRGQAVTVYSRAAGVTVRTTARAKDEGCLNALIAVETIDTKQSFFARVRGPQEVEVLAQAASTRAVAPPSKPAPAVATPAQAVAAPAEPIASLPTSPSPAAPQRSSWLSPAARGGGASSAATGERLKWRSQSQPQESLQ